MKLRCLTMADCLAEIIHNALMFILQYFNLCIATSALCITLMFSSNFLKNIHEERRFIMCVNKIGAGRKRTFPQKEEAHEGQGQVKLHIGHASFALMGDKQQNSVNFHCVAELVLPIKQIHTGIDDYVYVRLRCLRNVCLCMFKKIPNKIGKHHTFCYSSKLLLGTYRYLLKFLPFMQITKSLINFQVGTYLIYVLLSLYAMRQRKESNQRHPA